MAQLLIETKKNLKQAVLDAVNKGIAEGVFPEAELPEIGIEIPADNKNGDFSTNAAMALARAFKSNPRQIAANIVERLNLDSLPIAKCDIAGAGFINFYLSEEYYAAVVKEAIDKGEEFGSSDFGKKERINVEFVSANPTGPMHMGNARGGALGDCLRIGKGRFQIPPFLSALKAQGFDGAVTLELYREAFGSTAELAEDWQRLCRLTAAQNDRK